MQKEYRTWNWRLTLVLGFGAYTRLASLYVVGVKSNLAVLLGHKTFPVEQVFSEALLIKHQELRTQTSCSRLNHTQKMFICIESPHYCICRYLLDWISPTCFGFKQDQTTNCVWGTANSLKWSQCYDWAATPCTQGRGVSRLYTSSHIK